MVVYEDDVGSLEVVIEIVDVIIDLWWLGVDGEDGVFDMLVGEVCVVWWYCLDVVFGGEDLIVIIGVLNYGWGIVVGSDLGVGELVGGEEYE